MALNMSSRSMIRNIRHLSRRSFSTTPAHRADHVRIVEVGPRDGLQNEKSSISVGLKTELVRRLATTGLRTIEAGSFVAPKWVPQMAASDKILEDIMQEAPKSPVPITYQWLLPNMRGLENFFKVHEKYSSPKAPSSTNDNGPALNTSLNDPNAMPTSTPGMTGASTGSPEHEVSIFLAATESFSKRNTNCTIAESLERFAPLMQASKDRGFGVRAYISVALGCPFEGVDVDPHKTAELAATLLEMGANEVSVCDTTGMGTAPRTRELLRTLTAAGIRNEDMALHFHDTFGQAITNTLIGLEHGIRTFDSAVGGLGGCPYSPGATGNVATEDLVYSLHSLGVSTGVDLDEISRIGQWITSEIGKPNESRAGKATLARLKRGDDAIATE